jgi:hypothetical protein
MYWCDAFIIIKWLKQLTCIIYTIFFSICVLIIINKKINNSLSIPENYNMGK